MWKTGDRPNEGTPSWAVNVCHFIDCSLNMDLFDRILIGLTIAGVFHQEKITSFIIFSG